jgi:hypothetical protein
MLGAVNLQLAPRVGVGALQLPPGAWLPILDNTIVEGSRYAIEIITPLAWTETDARTFMGPDIAIDFVGPGGVGGMWSSFLVIGKAKATRFLVSTPDVTYGAIFKQVEPPPPPPPPPPQPPQPPQPPVTRPSSSGGAVAVLLIAASLGGLGYAAWKWNKRRVAYA